eukprot:TRINITY_DN29894_c0_g1_i1.p1 TRINITY_DN29894_c0_g1~~TRINITY_DN29894_c0_g1_i1.p1  ORF type:complete len:617 (+),score=267.27 TRINITY_DN29894_c0_g1_i1:62-1912(+)
MALNHGMKGSLGRLLNVNHQNLPRLPIPALGQTLTRYLDSLRPLTTDAEFAAQAKLVKAFEEGPGAKLQASLLERDAGYAKAGGHPYFHFEGYWDEAYLAARCPNTIHINPFYVLNPPVKGAAQPHAMIRNAAGYMNAAAKWVVTARKAELQDDGGDMSQLAMWLGTARLPGATRDTLKFYGEESSHVVVVCKGDFFKVDVLDAAGAPVAAKDLAASLKAIVDLQKGSEFGVGGGVEKLGPLTSLPRDQWSEVRCALEADATNAAGLAAIDSALTVIALDLTDGARDGGLQSVSDSLIHGSTVGATYRNRWYDKHQVVFDAAGTVGVVFEHSPADGGSWNKALTDMWADYAAGVQEVYEVDALGGKAAAPLAFNIDDAAKKAVHSAEAYIRKELEGELDLEILNFDDFGKTEVKKWKLSPDAVCQVAFQLAYQKLHQTPGVTYEACAMRGFFHGRTETIRSLHPASAAFVQAMLAKNHLSDKDALKDLLRASCAAQSELAKAAATGQGIDRHLMSLQKEVTAHNVLPEGTAGLEMFADPLFGKSKDWTLSTSNVTHPAVHLFGFGPVTTGGYGYGYMIFNDNIPMCLTSWRSDPTSSADMRRAVHDSLHEIRHLFL